MLMFFFDVITERCSKLGIGIGISRGIVIL